MVYYRIFARLHSIHEKVWSLSITNRTGMVCGHHHFGYFPFSFIILFGRSRWGSFHQFCFCRCLGVAAFVCLLEEIFDIEKRNNSTKLCFYFTRALTFDSFYATSMIILVKTMLDLKTGNNFLLDAAWIYTTLLYMAMHSLNDWLLIYHKIQKVSGEQKHLLGFDRWFNVDIQNSVFVVLRRKIACSSSTFRIWMGSSTSYRPYFCLSQQYCTSWCPSHWHHCAGVWCTCFWEQTVSNLSMICIIGIEHRMSNVKLHVSHSLISVLMSGHRRGEEYPSGVCCIFLTLSMFLVTFKGYGRVGLKESSPFFKVIHRIYFFSTGKWSHVVQFVHWIRLKWHTLLFRFQFAVIWKNCFLKEQPFIASFNIEHIGSTQIHGEFHIFQRHSPIEFIIYFSTKWNVIY